MRRDLPAYLSTIGISASLMFVLELLAGRLVLPVFGGSPAVWTTALCFFKGVVFLGYPYAHQVVTRLRPGRGAVVHLSLVALALVAALAARIDVAAGGVHLLHDEPAPLVMVRDQIAGAAAVAVGAPLMLVAPWAAVVVVVGLTCVSWWLVPSSEPPA